MMGFRSLLLTLLITYAVGVLASRWLVLRAFVVDGPTLAMLAIVPLVQTALLIARRWTAARRR